MWISWAMRRQACVVCTKPIEPGDPVMVGQWKRTGPYGTRTNRTMSHFQCWVTKAQVWFDDNPYAPVIKPGTGRKTVFNVEQKKRRNSLRAMINQNRKKQQEYIGDGMWIMAEKYADKVRGYREELEGMLS